jgi:hypothetical protein
MVNDTLSNNTSQLITIITFNPVTRQIQYNPNIDRLSANAVYVDQDNVAYTIAYYNHKARVAFALLKDNNE